MVGNDIGGGMGGSWEGLLDVESGNEAQMEGLGRWVLCVSAGMELMCLSAHMCYVLHRA